MKILAGYSLRKKVYNAPNNVYWTPAQKLWYSVRTARGLEFVVVDFRKKTRQPAFNQEQLAKKLSEATDKKIDPFNLPFTAITYGKDRDKLAGKPVLIPTKNTRSSKIFTPGKTQFAFFFTNRRKLFRGETRSNRPKVESV